MELKGKKIYMVGWGRKVGWLEEEERLVEGLEIEGGWLVEGKREVGWLEEGRRKEGWMEEGGWLVG